MAASTVTPDAPPAGPRRPGAPRGGRTGLSQSTMVVVLSILTVVVIGLIVWAFVLRPAATVTSGQGAQTTTTVNPDAPGPTLPDSAFSTYTSPEMGFTMKYPTDWLAGKAVDGELVVQTPENENDLISARKLTRTEVPTTVDNLANLKAVTDGLVGDVKSAVILKVQAITLNGMPGYYYLYTFTSAETGAVGAHAQYFLFRGRNMYTLVFQALPQEGFARLSGVFDQMAASFQTEPDLAPPPETTSVPEAAPTTVG